MWLYSYGFKQEKEHGNAQEMLGVLNVGFESTWHANFLMSCSHAMDTVQEINIMLLCSLHSLLLISSPVMLDLGKVGVQQSSSATALLGIACVSSKAAFRVFAIHLGYI